VTASPVDVSIRSAALEEILDLRNRVLIAGTARTDAAFEGDAASDTRHFGAFEARGAGRCVGCASYMRSDMGAEPAYQLRGMAVAPGLQRRGIGAALLAYAESQIVAETRVRSFWCNARIAAVGFYERQGWRAAGGVFEIEGVGPHRRLLRKIDEER
jgi:GNAT superfamily N-acetyltransferase